MRISFFRYERLLLLTILSFSLIALWLTAIREECCSVVFHSYQDLYGFTEKFHIYGFDWNGPDQFTVKFREASVAQSGLVPDGPLQSTVRTISEGRHPYAISDIDGGETTAFWTIWGKNIAPIELGNSSILIGRPNFQLSDFVTDASKYPKDHIEQARGIAAKEFGVQADATSMEKLRSLTSGLHQSLFSSRGYPLPYMRHLSGFLQYKEALQGRSGVYCANQAEILAYFANAIGIPTRIISVGGELDDVALGAHAFVESFIQETGRWMYIDLQSNIFGIYDGDMNYLNAADILHRMASGNTASLTVEEFGEDGFKLETFTNRAEAISFGISPQVTLRYLWNSTDRYHPLERLKRLLLKPEPGYSLRQIGFGAELRILITAVLLTLLIVWVILRVQHRRF